MPRIAVPVEAGRTPRAAIWEVCVDLGLSDDQEQLVAAFSMLCSREVTPERVRDAEPSGFDPALWESLVALGAPGMGAPEAAGGGATLVDLVLAAEVLGNALAPVPFCDHAVAGRTLAGLLPSHDPTLAAVVAGKVVSAVAPVPATHGTARVVPAGGIAGVVVGLDGEDLVLVEQDLPGVLTPNLGATPVAHVDLRGARRRVLATAADARAAHRTLVDEWRILSGATLVGVGAGALALGVEYAKTRRQFGAPIGSYQAIAHPLADAATAVDGARLLAREAAWAAAEDPAQRSALAAMAFVFCGETAQRAAAVALHTHGGYGFMLEYDVQLYYRRAKAWSLVGGDPRRAVAELGNALFGPVTTAAVR
jgi:alkylation response protein AidB-like acyl-CoA dehydrogenase